MTHKNGMSRFVAFAIYGSSQLFCVVWQVVLLASFAVITYAYLRIEEIYYNYKLKSSSCYNLRISADWRKLQDSHNSLVYRCYNLRISADWRSFTYYFNRRLISYNLRISADWRDIKLINFFCHFCYNLRISADWRQQYQIGTYYIGVITYAYLRIEERGMVGWW